VTSIFPMGNTPKCIWGSAEKFSVALWAPTHDAGATFKTCSTDMSPGMYTCLDIADHAQQAPE
jgi:hypothetical protein